MVEQVKAMLSTLDKKTGAETSVFRVGPKYNMKGAEPKNFRFRERLYPVGRGQNQTQRRTQN